MDTKWYVSKRYVQHESVYQCFVVLGYARTLTDVLKGIARIREEFPSLRDEDITIQIYAGDTYKSMMGVEFDLPAETQLPEEWGEVNQHPPHY
jgi:hypothetical protein